MERIIEEILLEDASIKEKIGRFPNKRSIFNDIKVERPFKSIIGFRGVGKTTLLVQLAIKFNGIYVRLDNLALKNIKLYSIIKEINLRFGYKNFFLDEIQSMENWEHCLKKLYEITDFNIIFTGSSALEIRKKNIDLSRRVATFILPPLSMREYILFRYNKKIEKINFEELFSPEKIKKKIIEIAPYSYAMNEYMEYGAFPFSMDSSNYKETFENILNKILHIDFIRIKELDQRDINMAFRIIRYISSGSHEVSINNLSNDLKVSKSKIMSLMELLEKSMLILKTEPKLIGRKLLRKHPKYNMPLPIRHSINNITGERTEIGNLREDFFLTGMFHNIPNIRYIKKQNKQPDFYIDGRIFEIGGKSKTRKQIRKTKYESYIVSDSMIADKNRIPLILFGFLY